jgi:FkbM family methyltransferase
MEPDITVRTPSASGPGDFRERFLEAVFRDSFGYVAGRDQEFPYPARLRSRSRVVRVGLVARGVVEDLARRLVHRAAWARRGAWVEQAARELAAWSRRLEELEGVYESLADEPSRELFVRLLEWRILGPHRVRLPTSPDRYRRELERLHREHLLEAGTQSVRDPFFPQLDRYAFEVRGSELTVETDETSMLDTFVLEQYAYRRGAVTVRAEPGDVVVDGGGGYGDTALYFASLVAPDGQVVVVEMDPRNRRTIERNLEQNSEQASRVRVTSAALWRSSGKSLRYVAGGKLSRLEPEPAGEGGTAETVTLDELVDRLELRRVDLLKLDVEGAELAALKGASRVLEQHRPKLAVALYHKREDLIEIPRHIEELGLGYRLFLDHTSPGWEETVLFGAPPADR